MQSGRQNLENTVDYIFNAPLLINANPDKRRDKKVDPD